MGTDTELTFLEKLAQEYPVPAISYLEPGVPGLIQEITEALPSILQELPEGIEKVAAAQDDGTPLPAVTKENIWRSPVAHPLVLALMLFDKYGPEFLDWDAEPLRETLRRQSVQLSNSVWTKIQAVRVLFTSPSPWRRWEAFMWCCQGLSGRQPTVEFVEEVELGEMACAVDIMKIVDKTRPMGEEVQKYVAASAVNLSIPYLPAPLDFAQDELEQREYRCTSCGTVDRDYNDVACAACGSKELHRLEPELTPLKKQVAATWNRVAVHPLEKAVSMLGESGADDIVFRLLLQWDHRNRVRSNLITQLRALRDT